MMKYSRHALLMAFFAVMVVFFTGCDQTGDTLPVTTSSTSADEMSILSPEALPTQLADGTLETDMVLQSPASDRRHMPFAIFRCLDLTEEQRTSIAGILSAGKDCPKSILDSLRSSEKPLIDAARAARKAVIDQVKAGTLTREEGRTQIQQINADLRAALESNPVREWAKAALAECQANIFAQIRDVLDATQQALWDQWVATGELPCKPTDGRPKGDTARPHNDTTRPRPDDHRPHDGRHRGPRG